MADLINSYASMNGWFKEVYSGSIKHLLPPKSLNKALTRKKQMNEKEFSRSTYKGRPRTLKLHTMKKGDVVLTMKGQGWNNSLSMTLNEQTLNELFDALVSVKSYLQGNKDALK